MSAMTSESDLTQGQSRSDISDERNIQPLDNKMFQMNPGFPGW